MTMSYEERIMVLRDKAADIGVELPIEVANYLAARSDSPNDLKSNLINVSSFARQRKRPISLELAQFYLDGVRPEGGIEALPTEVTTQQWLGASEQEPPELSSTAAWANTPSAPVRKQPARAQKPPAPAPVAAELTEAEWPTLELFGPEPALDFEPAPEFQPSTPGAFAPAFQQNPLGGTGAGAGAPQPDVESTSPYMTPVPTGHAPFGNAATVFASEPDRAPDQPELVYEPLEDEMLFSEDFMPAEGNDSVTAQVPVIPSGQAPSAPPVRAAEPVFVPPAPVWPAGSAHIETPPVFTQSSAQQPAQGAEAETLRQNSAGNVAAGIPAGGGSAPLAAPAPIAPVTASAPVQFVPVRSEHKHSMIERIGVALKRAGIEKVISEGDKVAIKVHFGEQGNTAFVSPIYIREVVRLVKELGGKPFVTDANTLYSGMRSNAIDHIQCALENGFSYATIGAPIIIADGLDGHSATEVRIDGKHFATVKLGSAAIEADAMVVVSHVKGHEAAGFGGALKNVGMGLGCRSAKQRMHSVVKPKVEFEKCINCGQCIAWCPRNCITTHTFPDGSRSSFIDHTNCVGCGECVAACAYGAIQVNWASEPGDFLERVVEHAEGALQNKRDKTIFLSLMTNISPDCDCWEMSDAPIVGDIGALAARDIVAIDQAAYDLITQAPGLPGSRGEGLGAGDDKFQTLHGVDGTHAMVYAEARNLGTRSYDLKHVG